MDPDLPLIETLKSGDDSGLDELMHRHSGPLFRFAFRYTQNETTAAEIVQETFVRAYFKAKAFVPKASVKTWLYTIALNLCRDAARKTEAKTFFVPFESKEVETVASEDSQTDNAPDRSAISTEERTLLSRAIAKLPSRLRDALILFALEGRTQKETAEILNTTPKTVELRVYRAKQKLRRLLDRSQS